MGKCHDYYKGDAEKVTSQPIWEGTGCYEPVSDYEVLMDTYKIVKKLQEHRKLLSAAIASLERLAAEKGAVGGQTPTWTQEVRVAKEHTRQYVIIF